MNMAVVLSGGTGGRFGADTPKQYLEIAGKPVLVYTIQQLQRSERVDIIAVVAAVEWQKRVWDWKEHYNLTKLRVTAPPGPSRQESILSGLTALKPLQMNEDDGVIIQDAARPLTTTSLIDSLLLGLSEAPAVMPALPVTDTVYRSRDGRWVDGLLERSEVYTGQAPEAFNFGMYLKLYTETPPELRNSMSGSCQLPQRAGWRVKIIPGEPGNIKLTYPRDIEICERLMRERSELL